MHFPLLARADAALHWLLRSAPSSPPSIARRFWPRAGRSLDWTVDDLDAAQLWANHDHYPHSLAAGSPASRFAARPANNPTKQDAFRQAVVQFEQEARPPCSARPKSR